MLEPASHHCGVRRREQVNAIVASAAVQSINARIAIGKVIAHVAQDQIVTGLAAKPVRVVAARQGVVSEGAGDTLGIAGSNHLTIYTSDWARTGGARHGVIGASAGRNVPARKAACSHSVSLAMKRSHVSSCGGRRRSHVRDAEGCAAARPLCVTINPKVSNRDLADSREDRPLFGRQHMCLRSMLP